jgi:type IV pilus assembly protein PilO
MLPRIVSLNDVGISPSNSGLTMDATAKTYRYLDENELASQKKGTKAAGSK